MFKKKDTSISYRTTSEKKAAAIQHAQDEGYRSLTDLIDHLLDADMKKKQIKKEKE